MSVTTYNGNPYIPYCVQWKSLYPLLCKMEIHLSVTAYDGNPYIRYCVQWTSYKFLYPLLRTMGIPISVTAYNGNAYNGNPNMRYCVQWESLHPLPHTRCFRHPPPTIQHPSTPQNYPPPKPRPVGVIGVVCVVVLVARKESRLCRQRISSTMPVAQ